MRTEEEIRAEIDRITGILTNGRKKTQTYAAMLTAQVVALQWTVGDKSSTEQYAED